ncbi:MAG: hypothetical protein ABMA13_23395 [Chthoniobacteraceae bacterium]
MSGQSGHNATFHVACVLLQGFDLPMSDAASVLAEFNARCAPPWSERELAHKLAQADKAPGLETTGGLKPRGCLAGEIERDDGPREPRAPSQAASAPMPMAPPVKPGFSAAKLRTFAARWREFIDTAWLADRSAVPPYRLGGTLSADEFLRAVFREGERVVCFTNQRSQGQAMWPLQHPPLGGDEGVWFLAQPVDGLEYVNPREKPNEDGTPRMSRRSEESVIDWRHLVLESDEADARDWMGALVQLPLRVVAIYTSGGRSIHALVRVDAKSKGDWDNVVKQIRPIFVTLGADPKAMSAVRLTRLPGCVRGERLQKLLYLNPEPEMAAICTLPKRHDFLSSIVAQVEGAAQLDPAAVYESGEWDTVEQFVAALRWFESAPRARAALARLTTWMNAGAGGGNA